MSSTLEHSRQKIGWVVWSTLYEAYCALRHPGRRWRMDCPYCDESFTARSWNMAVLKTDIHVANTETGDHTGGDATVEADDPGTDNRQNPVLEADGGWSA